jgi:hypothetical protein
MEIYPDVALMCLPDAHKLNICVTNHAPSLEKANVKISLHVTDRTIEKQYLDRSSLHAVKQLA